MQIESKITAKGQTTVPREVRDHLGLSLGDRIGYVLEDGKVVMVARNKRLIDLVEGLGTPPAGPKSLEEIEAGIASAWSGAEESGKAGR